MAALDPKKKAEIVSKARGYQAELSQGYRERALKLFPHVCARCGREFEGKTLKELTVHHKDHNHNNNPPDGSNWELLCVYCHDDEHQEGQDDGGHAFGLVVVAGFLDVVFLGGVVGRPEGACVNHAQPIPTAPLAVRPAVFQYSSHCDSYPQDAARKVVRPTERRRPPITIETAMSRVFIGLRR